MEDLPYQVEYAKSGRAGCKGCKQKIDQGILRIAVMVQSAFHDGKQPNWYHEDCFFQKQRPKSAGDIAKLNTLKFEDQKRLTATIDSSSGIALPAAKGKGKGKKRANGDSNAAALRDFKVEYSKSSRATCCVCEIKICKDEVRCAKIVFDTEVGQKFGGQPLWHHVKCFAEARSNLLYFAGGEDLPGFNSLSKEDKAMVKKEIKALKQDDVPIKKLKAEPQDDDDKKAEKEFEKKLEKQSKLYYKYREALGHKQVSKSELHMLLEINRQQVPAGNDELISRVADMMAFGALEPCSVCKNGQLILNTYAYTCTGNMNEWASCTNSVTEPKRVAMKVPSGVKKNPAFAKYKPKVDVRVFMQAPLNYIVKKEENLKEENGVKNERRAPPLKNLQFFLYGKLSNKEAVKHRVLKLGGLVVSKLVDTVVAVISTKKDLERMPAKMLEIQEKDIEVVEEAFLDLIDADAGTIAKSLELIKEHNIAEWGSDPAKRLPQDVIDGKSIPKSGSLYVKSGKSGVKKLKVKEGTTVDPDSGLEDVAHVYKDAAGTKYTVVLNQTDVQKKRNSYYKLQILQQDNGKRFWLFRSWGRIGTTIGGNKLDDCSSPGKALSLFKEHYLDKTKNHWEERDHFVKRPDGYYPVEVEYGSDQTEVSLQTDAACSLPMPVQQLVRQIFDINLMKATLLQFELDTEKMPLGKLSKKQIKAGYNVLSDLLKQLKTGQAAHHQLIAATNSFYTLIPHDFGINNPPLLDTEEAIKKKTEMLDNLLEIEIAYNLLTHDDSSAVSPIETHYLKLRARLEPLAPGSPEHGMLAQYVRNTHAATHSQYTLQITQVFKVVRDGEDRRYKPFRKLHNRRLLWHGSRVTNFAGILSQGLRIAPPEAPATGYMFGKGVYFADMVSKSANYCCATPQAPDGVMLLCEVACGDMHECTQAEYVTKLPAGKHSTYGMGQTFPDPEQNLVLEDGLIVPNGTPIKRDVHTSLLYNEYIVYDVAQVNVKYLFQMKFNFKYGR